MLPMDLAFYNSAANSRTGDMKNLSNKATGGMQASIEVRVSQKSYKEKHSTVVDGGVPYQDFLQSTDGMIN